MFKALMGGGRSSSDLRSSSGSKSSRRKTGSRSSASSTVSRKSSRGDDRDRGLGDLSAYPSSGSRSRRYAESAADESVASSYATAQPNYSDDRAVIERTSKRRESDYDERYRDDWDRERKSESRRERDRERERARSEREDSRDRDSRRRENERAHSGDSYLPPLATGAVPAPVTGAPYGAPIPTSHDPSQPSFPITLTPEQMDAPSPSIYDPHVQQQFPGQFQNSTEPYRPPNPAGEAADYYGDQGQSVAEQPGVRPKPPLVIPNSQAHLMTASPSANPPPEPSSVGGVGAAADYYTHEPGLDTQHSEQPVSASSSRPPKPSKPSHSSAQAGALGATVGAAAATYGLGHYSTEQVLSESPATYGIPASSSRPPQSQPYVQQPQWQAQPLNHSQSHSHGVGTAVGAAAAGAAAGYMLSHHHNHSSSSSDHVSQYTMQNHDDISYSGPGYSGPTANPALYAAGIAGAAGLPYAASPLHPHHAAVHHGSPFQSGGMAFQQRQRGPLDKFVDFWRDPEGVGKFEDYTEAIGVCKYCFEPGTTSKDAPRPHNYRRRRSSDRVSAGSRVEKLSRYASSEDESRRRKSSKSSWLPAILGGYAVKSLFNNKDFDDSYSVQSGRVVGAYPDSESNSTLSDKRSKTSRGVYKRSSRSRSRERVGRAEYPDPRVSGYEGSRISARPRSRSRSRSSSRSKSHTLRDAAIGAAIGTAAASAVKSHHRSRSRSRSRSPRRSRRRKSSSSESSFVDISKQGKKSSVGFGSFFTASSANKKRRSKRSRSIFSFTNSSSSSLDNDLAFGSGFTKKLKGKSKRRSSKEKKEKNVDAKLLALGATATALAASSPGRSRRTGEILVSNGSRSGRSDYTSSASNDDGWEDMDSDGQASSVSSGLAFGASGHFKRSDSHSSDSSSSGWGWGWGVKSKKKKSKRRSSSENTFPTGVAVAAGAAGALGTAALASGYHRDHRDRREPSEAPSSFTGSLQHVAPMPTSDPSRFEAVPITSFPPDQPQLVRPGPIPLQQPQPVTPVSQAVYTSQGAPIAPFNPPIIPIMESPFPSYEATARDAAVAVSEPQWRPQPAPYPVPLNELPRAKRSHHRSNTTPVIHTEPLETASGFSMRRTNTAKDQPSVQFDLTEEQEHKERRAERLEKLKSDLDRDLERQNRIQMVDREDPVQPRGGGYRADHYRDREPERERERDREWERERERERDRDRQRERERDQQREKRAPREDDFDRYKDSSWAGPVAAGAIGAAAASTVLSGKSAQDDASETSESRRERRRAERRRATDPTSVSSAPPPLVSSQSDFTVRPKPQEVIVERSNSASPPHHYKTAAFRGVGRKKSVYDDYATFFYPEELRHSPDSQSRNESPVMPTIIEIEPASESKRENQRETQRDQFEELPIDFKGLDRLPWPVPELRVIEPTPPHSTAGSVRDASSPIITPADPPVVEKEPERPTGSRVSWGEHQTHEYEIPSTSSERSSLDLDEDRRRSVGEEPRDTPIGYTYIAPSAHETEDMTEEIEFAATVAAAAQAAGFDPSLITEDPIYRTRTSPPGSDTRERSISPSTRAPAPPTQFHGFVEGEIDTPQTPKEQLFREGPIFPETESAVPQRKVEGSRDIEASAPAVESSTKPVWSDTGTAIRDIQEDITEPKGIHENSASETPRKESESPEEDFFIPGGFESEESPKKIKRRSTSPAAEYIPRSTASYNTSEEPQPLQRSVTDPLDFDADDAPESTVGEGDGSEGKKKKRRKRRSKRDSDFDDNASVASSVLTESSEKRKSTDDKAKKSGGFLSSIFGSRVSEPIESKRSPEKLVSREVQSEIGTRSSEESSRRRRHRSSSRGDSLDGRRRYEDEGLDREDSLADKENINVESYKSSRQRREDRRRQRYGDMVGLGESAEFEKEPRTSQDSDREQSFLVERPELPAAEDAGEYDGASGPNSSIDREGNDLWLGSIARRPRSHSTSPPSSQKIITDAAPRSISPGPTWDRGGDTMSRPRRPSDLRFADSPTAVPLHFRPPPTSPRLQRSPSITSPTAPSPTSPSQGRRSRPNSSEFKNSREIRPLFLVERHGASKIENQLDELLPSLPSSKSTSAEDLTALPDEHSWESAEYSRGFYDTQQPAQEYYGHDVLGSQSTTPTKAAFDLPRHLSRKEELGYEFHSPSELLQGLNEFPDLPPSPAILPSVEGSQLWMRDDDGLERDLESLPPLPNSRPSTPENKAISAVEQTTPTQTKELPTTDIPGLHDGPGFAGVVDAAVTAAVATYPLKLTDVDAPYPDHETLAKSRTYDAEDEDAVRTITGGDVTAITDISPARTPTVDKDRSASWEFGAVVDAALAAKGITDDDRAMSVADTTEDEFFDATGSPAGTISRDEFEFVNAEDARGFDAGPGTATPTTVTGDIFEDVLESRRASETEPMPERTLDIEPDFETVKADETPQFEAHTGADTPTIVTRDILQDVEELKGDQGSEKTRELQLEPEIETAIIEQTPLLEASNEVVSTDIVGEIEEKPADEPTKPMSEGSSELSSSASKKKNKKKKKKGKGVDLGDLSEEKLVDTPVSEPAPEVETQTKTVASAIPETEEKKVEEDIIAVEVDAQREIVPESVAEPVAPAEEPVVSESAPATEDGQTSREIQPEFTASADVPEMIVSEGVPAQVGALDMEDPKPLKEAHTSELAAPEEVSRAEFPEVPTTEELPPAEESPILVTEQTPAPATEPTATEEAKVKPVDLSTADAHPQEPEEAAAEAGLSKKAKKKKKKAAAAAGAAATVALEDTAERHGLSEGGAVSEVSLASEEKGPASPEEAMEPTEATEQTYAPQDATEPIEQQLVTVPEDSVPTADVAIDGPSEQPVEIDKSVGAEAPNPLEEPQKPLLDSVPGPEAAETEAQDDPLADKALDSALMDKQSLIEEPKLEEEPASVTEELLVDRENPEPVVEPVPESEQKDEQQPGIEQATDVVEMSGDPEQQAQDTATPAEIVTPEVEVEASTDVVDVKPESEAPQPEEASLSRKPSKKKKKNKRKGTTEPEPEREAEAPSEAAEAQPKPETQERIELEPETRIVVAEDDSKLQVAEDDTGEAQRVSVGEIKEGDAPPEPLAAPVEDVQVLPIENESEIRASEELPGNDKDIPTETVVQEPALEVADEPEAADQPVKAGEIPEEFAEEKTKKKNKKKKNRKSTLVPEPEPEEQPEPEPETKPEEPEPTTEDVVAPPETSGQATPPPQPIDDNEQQEQEQQEDAGTAGTQAIAAPLEKVVDEPSESVENAETNDSEPHVPEQPTVEPEAGEASTPTGKRSTKNKNKKQSISVSAEDSSTADAVAPVESEVVTETPAAEVAPDAVAEPETEVLVAPEEPLISETTAQAPAEEMSRDIDVPADSAEAPVTDQSPEPEAEQESAPPMTAAQKKKAKKDKKKKRQSLAAEKPELESDPSEPVVQKAPDVPVDATVEDDNATQPQVELEDVPSTAEELKEPVVEHIEAEINVPGQVLEQVDERIRDEPTAEAQPISETLDEKAPEPEASTIIEPTLSDYADNKMDNTPAEEQTKEEPVPEVAPIVEPAADEAKGNIPEQKIQEPDTIIESVPETPTDDSQPTSSKKDKKKKKKKRLSISVEEPEPEAIAAADVGPLETPADRSTSDALPAPDETPAEESGKAAETTESPTEPPATTDVVPDVSTEDETPPTPATEEVHEIPVEAEAEQPAVVHGEDAAPIPGDEETLKRAIPEEPVLESQSIEPQAEEQEQLPEGPRTSSSKKKNKKKKKKSQSSVDEDLPMLTTEEPVSIEPTDSITNTPVPAEPEKVVTEASLAPADDDIQVVTSEPTEPVSETLAEETKKIEAQDVAPAAAAEEEEVQTASSKKKAKKDKKKRKSVSFATEDPSSSAAASELTEPATEVTTPEPQEVSEEPQEHTPDPTASSEAPASSYEPEDAIKQSQTMTTLDEPSVTEQPKQADAAPETSNALDKGVEDVAPELSTEELPKNETETSELKEEVIPGTETEETEARKDTSDINVVESTSEPTTLEPSAPVESAIETTEPESATPKSKKNKKKKKRKTLELEEEEESTPVPEVSEPAETNPPDLTETATPEPEIVEQPAKEPVQEPTEEPEKQEDEPKSAKAKKKAKKEKKRQAKLLAAESEPSTPTEEKPEEPTAAAEPSETAAEEASLETTKEQGPDTQIPAETAISPAEDDGKENQSHDTGFHADTDKDLTWTDNDVSSQVEQKQMASTEPERESVDVEGMNVTEAVEEATVQAQHEVVESQQPSIGGETSGDTVGEGKGATESEVVPDEESPESEIKEQSEQISDMVDATPVEVEATPEEDMRPIASEDAEPVEEQKAVESVSQPENETVKEAEPGAPAIEAQEPESTLPTSKLSKKQKKKLRQAQKAAADQEQAAEATTDDGTKPKELPPVEEELADPQVWEEAQEKAVVSEMPTVEEQVTDVVPEDTKRIDDAGVAGLVDESVAPEPVQEANPTPETVEEGATERAPEVSQDIADIPPIEESMEPAAEVAEVATLATEERVAEDKVTEISPMEPEPVPIEEFRSANDKSLEIPSQSTNADETLALSEPVNAKEIADQEKSPVLEALEEDVSPPSQEQEEPTSGSSKKKKKKNKKKAAAQAAEANEEPPVTAPELIAQTEVAEEVPPERAPELAPMLQEISEDATQPEITREVEPELSEPHLAQPISLEVAAEPEQPKAVEFLEESPELISELEPLQTTLEDQPEIAKDIEQETPQPQIQEPPFLEAEPAKEEQPVIPSESALETPSEEKTVEVPTLSRKQSKKQKKKAKKQAKEQLEEPSTPAAAEPETAVENVSADTDVKAAEAPEVEPSPALEQAVAPETVETEDKHDVPSSIEAEKGLEMLEDAHVEERHVEEQPVEEVVDVGPTDGSFEAVPLPVNIEELDFPEVITVQKKAAVIDNVEYQIEEPVEISIVAPLKPEQEPEVLKEDSIEEVKVEEVDERENEHEEQATQPEIVGSAIQKETYESAEVERDLSLEPEPEREPVGASVSRKLSKKEKKKLKKQAELEAAKVEEPKEEVPVTPVKTVKDITIPQEQTIEEQTRELPLEAAEEVSFPRSQPEPELEEPKVEGQEEHVAEIAIPVEVEEPNSVNPLKEDDLPMTRKLSKKEKKKKRKESKVEEEPLESEPVPLATDQPEPEQPIDKSLESGEVREERHDDDAWPPIDWAKGKIDATEQSSQSSDEAHAGRFEPEIPEFKESAIPEALMERPSETPQEAAKGSRAQPMIGTIERDVTARDFTTRSAESALQTLHDVESSSEKSETKPSKIASIFPNLERGFFRRPSPTQSVKDGAEEETMEEAIRDSAIQVLEAPIAREVEMPRDLRDSGYISSIALAQDDVFGISTTRELPSTKSGFGAEPPVAPETEFRSVDNTQDLRRSPSIHGRHEKQGLPWSLEETKQPATERDISPPRPLHSISEQEPERPVARDGTPRLELKPEHVLPRPETPVRKFTETALGRRAWPTPDNSDDDWEKIEKPSPRLSPDRGLPGILKTPEHDKPVLRPSGSVSAKGSSHSLRRVVHSASGDLRTAALAATAATVVTSIAIAGEAPEEERQSRPITPQPQAPAASRSPTDLNIERIASSSSYDPVTDKGKQPVRNMTDVYEGWGETPSSPRSPSRPPSIRHRRSMQHLQELEFRLDHLIAENRELAAARDAAESKLRSASLARRKSDQALNTRDADLRDREADLDKLKQSVEWFQKEVARLNEENAGLTTSNAALIATHTRELQSMQQTSSLEAEQLRSQNERLSRDLHERIKQEIETALGQKNTELRRLREELESARDKVKELQQQISTSMNDNVIAFRGEDYFEAACQKLCGHVQQWVLRFSKHSDSRRCRRLIDIQDEKIADRFDNAILDGSDTDAYLGDRVRRRDVFMSVVMTMVWEFIFTRYLFGMDREQRQKLKSLEKQLIEVGPRNAIHRWRATTLSLLARRPAFAKQRENDTEAVALEIFDTLSRLLPPPREVESQLLESLRKVLRVAVNLSIEMRTQLAEFIMLPPLQPEYDTNGDLARQVFFNASLMNERSGETTSNDELQAQNAVVRVVLFPLVVKKGNDAGEGDEEVVVCPAQVLVARPGKERRLTKMTSGDRMSVEASRSVHSIAPSTMDMSMNMSMSNVI
ncbi:hypothetical protein BJX64DRAFT_11957 [Aspergillus heterothallicus]